MRRIRIDFSTKNLEEKIKRTKIILNEIKEEGANFEFDLTKLNFIDATKAALLLSTEAFKLNTKTKIECLVRDEAKKFITKGKLKNTCFGVRVSNVKDYKGVKKLKTGSI